MALIDFIIIGAMKGGSSALYHWLDAHPQTAMSSIKEPRYWSQPKDVREQRAQYYRTLFKVSGLKGEASTAYTKRPLVQANVAKALLEGAPEVKLIYLVRNPIERYISHVHFNQAKGREGRSIHEILAQEPGSHYLACSQYAYQLEPYEPFIRKGQLMVLSLEKLVLRPTKELDRLCRFLGIEPAHREFRVRNPTALSVIRPLLLRRLKQQYGLFQSFDRVLCRLSGFKSVYKKMHVDLPRPILSTREKANLWKLLSADVAELQSLSQERFDEWTP